jgi:hypothetical protein
MRAVSNKTGLMLKGITVPGTKNLKNPVVISIGGIMRQSLMETAQPLVKLKRIAAIANLIDVLLIQAGLIMMGLTVPGMKIMKTLVALYSGHFPELVAWRQQTPAVGATAVTVSVGRTSMEILVNSTKMLEIDSVISFTQTALLERLPPRSMDQATKTLN